VHPEAIKVMAELDIDLSGHRSKHLDEFKDQEIDTVITVCENAESCCPPFNGEQNHYCWSFADPADATGRNEFRKIRDEIKVTFDRYADELSNKLQAN